jgi:hypothetical protein
MITFKTIDVTDGNGYLVKSNQTNGFSCTKNGGD